MNNFDLPQIESGQPEIYRILKLGDYSIGGSEDNFKLPIAELEPISKATTLKRLRLETLKQTWDFVRPYTRWMFYPLVFIISFSFFYFTMNFPSLMVQAQGFFTKSQDEQIVGKDLAAYNQWMGGYFYSVSNKDLLTPTNDYDHDGLTNYDEFVMRTNPTITDSDADGISDGVEVLNYGNVWGRGDMTREQKNLRDKLDLILISERISFSASSNQNNNSDPSSNFDLDKPGQLSIPKLNMQVPLIFSKDPSDFDNDLQHGVIHYPGTALPGQKGIVYVSGHSSDYIWKHDPFAHVFTQINHLSVGDDIFINVTGKDGKLYSYRYRVTTSRTYSPDDQTQFIDNSSEKLNLSTCWPIGTQKDRLVVTAELAPL